MDAYSHVWFEFKVTLPMARPLRRSANPLPTIPSTEDGRCVLEIQSTSPSPLRLQDERLKAARPQKGQTLATSYAHYTEISHFWMLTHQCTELLYQIHHLHRPYGDYIWNGT
jgi:hypothetical protein